MFKKRGRARRPDPGQGEPAEIPASGFQGEAPKNEHAGGLNQTRLLSSDADADVRMGEGFTVVSDERSKALQGDLGEGEKLIQVKRSNAKKKQAQLAQSRPTFSSKSARILDVQHVSWGEEQEGTSSSTSDVAEVARQGAPSKADRHKKKKKRSDKKSHKSSKKKKSKHGRKEEDIKMDDKDSSSSSDDDVSMAPLSLGRHDGIEFASEKKSFYSKQGLEELKRNNAVIQSKASTLSEDEEEREWERELLKRSGNAGSSSQPLTSLAQEICDERDMERLARTSGRKEAGVALLQAMQVELAESRAQSESVRRRLNQVTIDVDSLQAKLSKSIVDAEACGRRHDVLQAFAIFTKGLRAFLKAKATMVRQAGIAMAKLRKEAISGLRDSWLQAVADAFTVARDSATGLKDLEIGDRMGDFPRRLLGKGDGTEKDEFGRDVGTQRYQDLLSRWSRMLPKWEASVNLALSDITASHNKSAVLLARMHESASARQVCIERKLNIIKGIKLVFADVEEPYDSLKGCLMEFAKWRDALPDDYAAAYADLAITDIASPYVQSELAAWDLLGLEIVPSKSDLFQLFQWESTMGETGCSKQVIAATYAKDVLPVLHASIKTSWDPCVCNGRATLGIVKRLLEHVSSLTPDDADSKHTKLVQAIGVTIVEKLCFSERSMCLPVRMKSTDHSKSRGEDLKACQALFLLQAQQLVICVSLLETCVSWVQASNNNPQLLCSIASLESRANTCAKDATGYLPVEYSRLSPCLVQLQHQIRDLIKSLE